MFTNLRNKNNKIIKFSFLVFHSNQEQLDRHLEESAKNESQWCDPVIRLRGLPYGCTKSEITSFFDGNLIY